MRRTSSKNVSNVFFCPEKYSGSHKCINLIGPRRKPHGNKQIKKANDLGNHLILSHLMDYINIGWLTSYNH